jgi:hypothetical protein
MAQSRPKNPYKVVPLPAGYRRALPKEITPKVQRAAVRALQQCLPIGKLQATEVDGKLYAFVTEGHYDDHVTKPGKPIWHPGISTIVPINQPKPVKLASQAVRDAQFINQSRMTGESTFEGEGLWSKFKKWIVGPPLPRVVSVKRAPLTALQLKAGQKLADEAAATPAVMYSNVNGDDVNFTGDFGDDPTEEDPESTYAADELYDSVSGDDFGDDDFGDEFGAARRKAKAKGKAKVQVKVKGKVTLGKRKSAPKRAAARPAPKRAAARPAPKRAAARPAPKRAAARPAPKRAAARPAPKRAAARPAPKQAAIPPRTTATKTDSPLGPSAPFDETMVAPFDETVIEPSETEMPEQVQEASPEVEAALDAYQEGGEETPETADEGSDTYDETAINGENYTHSKYSVGA